MPSWNEAWNMFLQERDEAMKAKELRDVIRENAHAKEQAVRKASRKLQEMRSNQVDWEWFMKN